MANELNIIIPITGLTVTGSVRSVTGALQGSAVSMTEVVTNQYSGTFDVSSLADGEFLVHFDTATDNVGAGAIYVRSGTEITQEDFATLPDIIVGANS